MQGAEYLKRILNARVYDVARETPLELAPILSRRTGNRVWLKREDLQPTFSFKVRGAYNKAASLSPEELARGLVASSAGNHAQGVALAAQRLGTQATIVMPRTTPPIQVEAVVALGAEVLLHGDDYDAAYARAREIESERGMTFIHPYDDPDVIAGQGTIGLEILRQHSGPLHAVFVAVGGGGLIAGMAVCIKELRPDVRVIGVEPEDSDSLARSLRLGERVRLDRVGTLADGVAVRQVGEETFRLAQRYVDEVVVVPNDEICAAVKDVFEDRRAMLEPSGALAYAGLKRYVEREGLQGADLVAIACGANVNFDRLRHISERAEIGERREAVLAVTIPERPGSFREFCATIGQRSITEFNYRYAGPDRAHVFVGFAIQGAGDVARLVETLRTKGYQALDLTDDETAKLHVRHMVGGHAPGVHDERLFGFRFPERPGALAEFLARLGGRWNISHFHYRNHGADFGRVLVGLQVPERDSHDLANFLAETGYEYSEESENPAYQLFLG